MKLAIKTLIILSIALFATSGIIGEHSHSHQYLMQVQRQDQLLHNILKDQYDLYESQNPEDCTGTLLDERGIAEEYTDGAGGWHHFVNATILDLLKVVRGQTLIGICLRPNDDIEFQGINLATEGSLDIRGGSPKQTFEELSGIGIPDTYVSPSVQSPYSYWATASTIHRVGGHLVANFEPLVVESSNAQIIGLNPFANGLWTWINISDTEITARFGDHDPVQQCQIIGSGVPGTKGAWQGGMCNWGSPPVKKKGGAYRN